MEIKNLLSSDELQLITDYMKVYSSENSMPAEKYLRHWLEAKSRWLLPIFGNQLRISFPVSYENPVSEEIRKIMYSTENQMRQERITTCLKKLLWEVLPEKKGWEINTIFSNIFCSYAFNDNALPHELYITEKIKFSQGEKPFRALNSLIKRLNLAVPASILADIEQLRLAHSQALNKKKVSGKLVLSIHPLDYMTMSDNAYDWNSCMSWANNGCYHAGTLEMLNSPSVIVAYLEGDKPYYPVNDARTWSNKKWRELFVLDHDFITGIKGYPYENRSLEEIILNKLADAAEKIFPKYERSIHYLTPDGEMVIDNKEYSFSTNLMYNDFENNGEEPIIYSTEINFENFYDSCYSYSGEAYCTVCGQAIESEEETLCDECNNSIYCYCCGEAVNEDEAFYIEGNYYCQDCAEEEFNYCERCSEYTSQEVTPVYELVLDNDNILRCWVFQSICEDCLNYFKSNEKIVFDERVNKYFWIDNSYRWDRNNYINPNTLSDEEIEKFF